MFCANCGSQIPDGSTMCIICGKNPIENVVYTEPTPKINLNKEEPTGNPEPNFGQNMNYNNQQNFGQNMNYNNQRNFGENYNYNNQQNFGQNMNYNNQPNYGQNNYYNQSNNAMGNNYYIDQSTNAKNVVALIFGILSIPTAILGGILFGFWGASIAIVFGILAVVFGIQVSKKTNKNAGFAAFVCGLIGLIFGALFFMGCSICGCSEFVADETCYSSCGICGGGCVSACDRASDIFD